LQETFPYREPKFRGQYGARRSFLENRRTFFFIGAFASLGTIKELKS
jgi:hypothetical protein